MVMGQTPTPLPTHYFMPSDKGKLGIFSKQNIEFGWERRMNCKTKHEHNWKWAGNTDDSLNSCQLGNM